MAGQYFNDPRVFYDITGEHKLSFLDDVSVCTQTFYSSVINWTALCDSCFSLVFKWIVKLFDVVWVLCGCFVGVTADVRPREEGKQVHRE